MERCISARFPSEGRLASLSAGMEVTENLVGKSCQGQGVSMVAMVSMRLRDDCNAIGV